MLIPLFSPECLLAAWLQPGRFVFDADMNYAAFVANGHCWSAASGAWLGPVMDGHLYDIFGSPVAWNAGAPLRATHRPLRPINVVRAVRPVQPVRPVAPPSPLTAPMPQGGWSALAFADWLVANDPLPFRRDEPPHAESSTEDAGASPAPPGPPPD